MCLLENLLYVPSGPKVGIHQMLYCILYSYFWPSLYYESRKNKQVEYIILIGFVIEWAGKKSCGF